MSAYLLFSFLAIGQEAAFHKPLKVESLPAISGTTLQFRQYDLPRPLKVWVLRVDLLDPDLAQTVSKPAPAGAKVKTGGKEPKELPAETLSQTTLEFARQERLDIAVNASPFSPVVKLPGVPLDINGLHLREHHLVSPPMKHYACWLLSSDHRLRFFQDHPPAGALNRAIVGTGGFGMVLVDGRVVERKAKDDPLHPRTALGVEEGPDGQSKAMVWVVIDGRQPKVSEGVSQMELGLLGKDLGCSQMLNLDGGGSSTLVMDDPIEKDSQKAGLKVRNTPVGLGNIPGTLRPNGNNWGLWRVTPENGVTAAQLKAIYPRLTPGALLRLVGPLNNSLRQLRLETPEAKAAFLSLLALPGGPLSEGSSNSKEWPPVQSGLAGLATEWGISASELQSILAEIDGKVLAARYWWQSNHASQALNDGKLADLAGLLPPAREVFEESRKNALKILSQKQAPGG